MPKFDHTRTRILLLILGLLLLLGGIALLRRDAIPIGLFITSLGVVSFLFSAHRLQKQPPTLEESRQILPQVIPGMLLLTSALMLIGLMYLITDPNSSRAKDGWANVLWVFSIVALFAHLWWTERDTFTPDRKTWWAQHRNEAALVFLLFSIALIARTIMLSSHPYPWSGDEASIGTEARRILNHEKTDLFATGWSGQPNWSFVPTALSLTLFGENIIGIRLVSALAGALTILWVYFLARELFNKTVGISAAGFLAFFPLHVHFSRIGVNNINDGFMVTLALWLLLRAVRTGLKLDYALAGLVTGLTIYTYVGTRLVFVMALGVLLYFIVFRKSFLHQNIRQLGYFGLSTLVTMTPMTYFFMKHPDIFMTRIGQEGILLNNWLGNEVLITGQSAVQIILNQISRSTLVFIAHGAPGNFFNSPEPYLTIMAAIFFLLGMGYSLQKIRESNTLILLGWFWSVVILGGILTLNPPANTRMVMTTPATAIFVGIGFWQLIEILKKVNLPLRWQQGILTALLLILAFQNSLFYFGEYRTGHYFQDANSEIAQAVGEDLAALGSEYILFMLGQPRMYSGFPTIPFLAPDNERHDLTQETIASIRIPHGAGAFFAATPENIALLEMVAAQLPGGTWQSIPRKGKAETLYHSYTIHPAE